MTDCWVNVLQLMMVNTSPPILYDVSHSGHHPLERESANMQDLVDKRLAERLKTAACESRLVTVTGANGQRRVDQILEQHTSGVDRLVVRLPLRVETKQPDPAHTRVHTQHTPVKITFVQEADGSCRALVGPLPHASALFMMKYAAALVAVSLFFDRVRPWALMRSCTQDAQLVIMRAASC